MELFFTNSSEIFNLINLIPPCLSAFGKEAMKVHLYLPGSGSFSVLDDFHEFLEIDKTKIVKLEDGLNINLIPEFTNLFLLINETALFRFEASYLRRQIVKNLLSLSGQFRSHSNTLMVFQELAEEKRELYLDSNRVFAQEYLVPSKLLFSLYHYLFLK